MREPQTGDVVRIASGTEILTGTITRMSASSIWAKFAGTEHRFVRSQDGGYRRYGRSTEQASPVLVFPRNLTGQPEMIQAALDAEAAAGSKGFHGKVTLTGRTHEDPAGEWWYEIEWDDAYTGIGKAWVSWDAPLDRRAPEPATATALTGWVDDFDLLLS